MFKNAKLRQIIVSMLLVGVGVITGRADLVMSGAASAASGFEQTDAVSQ